MQRLDVIYCLISRCVQRTICTMLCNLRFHDRNSGCLRVNYHKNEFWIVPLMKFLYSAKSCTVHKKSTKYYVILCYQSTRWSTCNQNFVPDWGSFVVIPDSRDAESALIYSPSDQTLLIYVSNISYYGSSIVILNLIPLAVLYVWRTIVRNIHI